MTIFAERTRHPLAVGLKSAEKRVLAFIAGKAETQDWFEVAQRQIVPACRISSRDVTPTLDRLAQRGLILLKVNHYYRAQQRTEVAFLVDVRELPGYGTG